MIERRWARVALALSVAFLVLATMVWLSGMDMVVGSMLYVVVGGWSLLAACRFVSFVQAARSRTGSWFQRWTAISLGCAVAFLWSASIGLAGLPEEARIGVSRDGLIRAGARVLAGENPARAGLYGFRQTSIDRGCAMMETGLFPGPFGFAYCPVGVPAASEKHHLGGGLYKYAYD